MSLDIKEWVETPKNSIEAKITQLWDISKERVAWLEKTLQIAEKIDDIADTEKWQQLIWIFEKFLTNKVA